jgi:hypothetical protein
MQQGLAEKFEWTKRNATRFMDEHPVCSPEKCAQDCQSKKQQRN